MLHLQDENKTVSNPQKIMDAGFSEELALIQYGYFYQNLEKYLHNFPKNIEI